MPSFYWAAQWEMFGKWSKKNPPQKVSHKDKIHFYGSDSTRNGGYALTPMPWTGPAPRTRTRRGSATSVPGYEYRARTGRRCVLATDDPQCVLPSRHIGYARPDPAGPTSINKLQMLAGTHIFGSTHRNVIVTRASRGITFHILITNSYC